MANAVASANSYYQVPYPARPFAETHPDRLATIGMLFGMKVQPIEHCRVLEIGCARGGNLIPMAEQLPGSQFLGIDLSQAQIAEARGLSEDAGVKNAQFLCLNILDFDASFGDFDYIICHGVFSWVSRQVQDKILQICASRLMPQGVAYVSYNTYPAWHTRSMLREMMYYHVSRFPGPQARIQEARGLLEFLIQSTPEDSLYGAILRSEAQALRSKEDGYLFHDELEEINAPIYFAQFAGRAQAQGLQFLAEADLSAMWSRHLPPGVAASLERLTADLIQREQYMDFVRNRDFRKTLLCHSEVRVDRELRPDGLGRFHIAAPVAPLNQSIDLHDSNPMKIRHLPSNQDLVATTPLWKGALLCLAEAWPGSVPFSELVAMARVRAGLEEAANMDSLHKEEYLLGKSILEMNLSGLAEIHSAPFHFCVQLSARPVASRLARVQAASGNRVTNLRHEPVVVGDLARHMLPHLDGSNDRTGLQSIANRLVQDGLAAIPGEGNPGENQDAEARLADGVDRTLVALARTALLTG
ncbi:MAG: methyltransferase regulatory domain-containing protein [Thermoguttaceae bacterium]